mgnify:CR=1 FL=1
MFYMPLPSPHLQDSSNIALLTTTGSPGLPTAVGKARPGHSLCKPYRLHFRCASLVKFAAIVKPSSQSTPWRISNADLTKSPSMSSHSPCGGGLRLTRHCSAGRAMPMVILRVCARTRCTSSVGGRVSWGFDAVPKTASVKLEMSGTRDAAR